MALLKSEWLPVCKMERVITHWTVGRHKANDFEREHYHFLVEESGSIVRGVRSIKDNVSTADGVYAAHTLGANSGSIGVALCGMIGTVEKPFVPGTEPVTKAQYFQLARVVGELCTAYKIAVSPTTVLGHGEVQANLGIRQRGKWDPMILPWDRENHGDFSTGERPYAEVGNYFRTLVRRAIGGEPLEPVTSVEPLIRVRANVRGTVFPDAILEDGSSYIKIRPVAESFDWQLTDATGETVTLKIGNTAAQTLPIKLFTGSGYVSARDLATALGVAPDWDTAIRTVIIP